MFFSAVCRVVVQYFKLTHLDLSTQASILQQLYRTQITATLRDANLATGDTSTTPDWRYIVCVPENVKKVGFLRFYNKPFPTFPTMTVISSYDISTIWTAHISRVDDNHDD